MPQSDADAAVWRQLCAIKSHLRLTRAVFGTEFFSVPPTSAPLPKTNRPKISMRVPSLRERNAAYLAAKYRASETDLDILRRERAQVARGSSSTLLDALPRERPPVFQPSYSVLDARHRVSLSPVRSSAGTRVSDECLRPEPSSGRYAFERSLARATLRLYRDAGVQPGRLVGY